MNATNEAIEYLGHKYELIDYTTDEIISQKLVKNYTTENMDKIRIEVISHNKGYLIQMALYDENETVDLSTIKKLAKFDTQDSYTDDSLFIAIDFIMNFCINRFDSSLECVRFDTRYIVFHLEPTALAI